eukprot:Sspe_Gene.25753::Locus_10423_Transcript_1_1_Confidence_1.000_Length_882::g.25753::m.25753
MGDAAFLPDKKGDVELDLSKRKYEVKGQGVEMDSGKPQRDERCTVRVFNLSTDISEDDLTQKFNKCGRTTRVNIPRDKGDGDVAPLRLCDLREGGVRREGHREAEQDPHGARHHRG